MNRIFRINWIERKGGLAQPAGIEKAQINLQNDSQPTTNY